MLHLGLSIYDLSYHVHACMILSCHVCPAIPFPYMHPLLCMPSTHHWHEQHCSTFAIYLSHQHPQMSQSAQNHFSRGSELEQCLSQHTILGLNQNKWGSSQHPLISASFYGSNCIIHILLGANTRTQMWYLLRHL